MRHTLPSYPVPEARYIERVLRHSPDSLVPLIAATSAGLPDVRDLGRQDLGPYGPWALLDVAWVSLALGRDGRSPATSDDLAEIVGLYLALDDPINHAPPGGNRMDGFLQRVFHQQGDWQESDYAQLSRSIALLQQTPQPPDLEVIRPGWDHDLLGCSLTDYVGLAELVWACATTHPAPRRRGRFAVEWYPARDYAEFDYLRSPAQVKKVLRRHFTTTKLRLRSNFPATADPLVRRYTHNALRSRPLVGGLRGGGYLVPVPAAVLHRATPLGLYYTGGDNNSERGKAFTRDVGHLFERYVGRHLDLLTDAKVHPEVEYAVSKKETGKSVDWIVVFDDLVLLVEVKSTRPGEALRLGGTGFTTILDNQFEKAFKQVNRSVDLIRSEARPEFDHIPRDRQMVGMVVTAEQFHQINTPEFRTGLPSTTVPVTVTSIHELEDAVTITGTSLADVLRASAAANGAALRPLFPGHKFLDHNAVLEQAWSAIPFARPRPAPPTGV